MSQWNSSISKLKNINSVYLFLRRLPTDIPESELKTIKEEALERILQIEIELLDEKNKL